MKILIVAVLTFLKSIKYLCNIEKQICLVILTFEAWSIENIFTLWACANIYPVFVFTHISSRVPGTLLRQFTRLIKATILLKNREIEMIPKFVFNLKKYSLKFKLSILYRNWYLTFVTFWFYFNILFVASTSRLCLVSIGCAHVCIFRPSALLVFCTKFM